MVTVDMEIDKEVTVNQVEAMANQVEAMVNPVVVMVNLVEDMANKEINHTDKALEETDLMVLKDLHHQEEEITMREQFSLAILVLTLKKEISKLYLPERKLTPLS
jgi:hypothetical protein